MRRALFFFGVLSLSVLAVTVGMRAGAEADESRAFSELRPVIVAPSSFGISPAVRSLAPAQPNESQTSKLSADRKALEVPNRIPFRKQVEGAAPDTEIPLASVSAVPMPTPSFSFDGLSSNDNFAAFGFRVMPPDPVGDIGFDHYVQAVNLLVRVYDKSGNALTPPFKMSSLFAPLGTLCSARDDGDPNVVFDPLANRWIISQFCTQQPPFRQMIAVSKSGDPTGEYYIYEFVMPNVKLNDYPKIGVWPNAYFMSTDEFLGSDYAGSGVFAFDRSKLLAGDPTASYIYFDLASPTTIRLGGLLPADLDGMRPPPAGTPGIFVGYSATEYGDPADAIRLFDFRPDFAEPFNSTFSERPESPISVPQFDPTSPAGRADIAQPAPGERLDSQSDRLMYRVAYRNSGNSESLVFNQTVSVGPGSDIYRAGVRLYEFRRNTGGAFGVNEASTIGDVETSRFMGAAAQDGSGNLAVGYSIGNELKPPSIAYSGRLATEPPGTFRTEKFLVEGTGVQKAFGFRWGDYSGLSVDPSDDCTFWATNQYYTLASQDESDFGWLTRIGRFRYSECSDTILTRIIGTVTNAANGQPIVGAVVTADNSYIRTTLAGGSYPDLLVVSGSSYQLRVNAPGFRSVTRQVTATGNGPIVQDFGLEPIAVLQDSGIEITGESCSANNAVDPGETVTINVSFRNTGAAAAANLTAALQQSGGVLNPSGPQNYGSMPPGGTAVARPYTFRAAPNLSCGAPLVLTFRLFDGAADLGTSLINLRTGKLKIAFTESFDSVTSPGLPSGWSTSATGAQQNWTTSGTRVQSPPNSAFSPDPNQVGLNELVSPAFQIDSASAEIEFRNWYELETTFLRNRLYDGSVLEIKIGNGDWRDIEAAGGRFLAGGYDGVIDSCCSNPLAGRRGWSGRSGPNQTSEFITSKAKLPPGAAGNQVRFRWRVGTDVGSFRTGQFIDNIVVSDGYVCDCATTSVRAPFDFDGDGRTDLSVFRPSDSPAQPDFLIRQSSNGAAFDNSWGSVGDVPANADYDGDGRTDIAVFRPSSRTWFILGSLNNSITALNFGLAGDVLSPADFDGDGKSDIAVFRPADGNWYIFRSLDSQVRIERFGLAGDVPVADDYDGDGKADLAVFRPLEGIWYVSRSSGGFRIERFGLAGDRPVAGDFDGDGRADLSLFRPTDRIWYQLQTSAGFSATQFGLADDRPLQADFDGDGLRDIGVFRPSSAAWYWIGSSATSGSVVFGISNDIAVPSIFVP